MTNSSDVGGVVGGVVAGVHSSVLQVLLVANAGPVTDRVGAALRSRGYAVECVTPAEPDLFSRALGHEAIVCLPCPSFVVPAVDAGAATGDPAKAVESVLNAGRAPGVQVLIFGLPTVPAPADATDATDATDVTDPVADVVEAIQRNGKPFIVVRSAPLLEEIASAVQGGQGTLWLPRTGDVTVSRADALAAELADAVESERQGQSWSAPDERMDIASVFAAASEMAGRPLRVRPVPALLFRTVRPIARWLDGADPPLLALADQLLAPHRAA